MSLAPLWRLLVATLTACSLALGLAAASRADEFPDGVRDTLGPTLRSRARRPRRPIARPRPDARVDVVRRWNQHRDRRERPRPHARRRGENRVFGEQLGPGPLEPRDGDRAHRDVRGGERDRRRLPRATPGCRARRADASLEAAVAQAAHDTLVALFPSQARELRRSCSPRTSRASRMRDARASAASRSARRAAAAILALRADDGSRARRAARRRRLHPERRPGRVAPGSDQPAPARARRALGRGASRSCCDRAEQFRVPPPPALDERRVRRRLRRGEARSAATASPRRPCAPRTRRRSASTGPTTARRACARRRASTTRSRCRSPTRRGTGRGRARAPARARERRDGRRRHRDLGVEVLLRVLAPGHRHPRVRRRAPVRPAPATATRTRIGDPTFIAARRAGEQPDRAELHAALPRLSVGPRRLRRRAVPDAAPLLRHRRASPFTFVSDEFNGVTRDNDGQRAAAAAAQLPLALAGRGGERPEPHLPRHPLVVRQDRGHRAGPARRALRVPPRVPADGRLAHGPAGPSRRVQPRLESVPASRAELKAT